MSQETPVIEGFARWLQALSRTGAHRVSQFVNADTRMHTPDVEAVGAAAIGAVYTSLFDDAEKVTIKAIDITHGGDGHTAYIRWDRLIVSMRGQKQALSGITEIMVGHDGKIASITEYWDRSPEPLKKRGRFEVLFNRKRKA